MSVPGSFLDDQVLGKAFDRRLMGRLLRQAVPYRRHMALALFLILATTGLGLAGPVLVMRAIDGPLRQVVLRLPADPSLGDPRMQLLLLALAFVGVSAVLFVLRFFEDLVTAFIGQKAMFDLRERLFAHLVRMPFAFYDRNPVGRLVTRMTSDIEALNELFSSGVVTFVADILVLCGIALVLVLVNPTLALVTVAILPLLLLVTFVFRGQARKYYRQQRGHVAHLTAFTQESIQGMSLIQCFHREEANQREHDAINAELKQSFLRSVMAYSLYFPAVEVLGTVALACVVWKGGDQLCTQPPALSFGQFFLFWYFLGRFLQPIRDMAERYNVLQAAMASAERVFKVLDTPETITDPPEPRPLERLRGRIAFDRVWFAYQGEEFVLRDVSFCAEPGQMLAIVGATGAGKSTVINLMSRFYDPQRGAILVDGVDVRDYRKRELRRRIAVVLQDVFLFSRSVRENLRVGDAQAPDEVLAACARHVHADRVISHLPGGLDHVLTERARTLSVGEKQLLAFARALVQDPDVLVLDEATAHIDSETEALIQDALLRLLTGRTSIVIAHRLSTIRRADQILVLHKGEIREVGRHEELLARGGIYRRLYELQYEDLKA